MVMGCYYICPIFAPDNKKIALEFYVFDKCKIMPYNVDKQNNIYNESQFP